MDLKDEKNRNLEKEIQRLQDELDETLLKLKRQDFVGGNRNSVFENVSEEALRQRNEELELKILNQEEEFMEKTENMQKEIEALKLQIIDGPVKKQYGKEENNENMEVAALSVENQKLKKTLKELQSKGGVRDDKETDLLRKKNKELETEKQKLADEIINIKVPHFYFKTTKEKTR